MFAVIAAVGHGGMSWIEDDDEKKKSSKKTGTGLPHARKRRLTTSRKGNDQSAKRHRKDDGAGDGSGGAAGDGPGGSGAGEGGVATI